MKILLLLALLLSFTAQAQEVPGEIECSQVPNDGTHLNVNLQPDADGKLHFKKCDPGLENGLSCVVYLDSTCNVKIKKLATKLSVSGKCILPFYESPTVMEIGFIPSVDDQTKHSISLTSNTEPGTDYFGDSYFCVKHGH